MADRNKYTDPRVIRVYGANKELDGVYVLQDHTYSSGRTYRKSIALLTKAQAEQLIADLQKVLSAYP